MQWHQLDKTEQARYYEMAREERAKHLQMYPGWSARDNYAVHKKRKKRKIKQQQQQQEPDDGMIVPQDTLCCSNSACSGLVQ